MNHISLGLDRPGLTVVRGINARGDLVGRDVDAAAGNKERGFSAEPKRSRARRWW
jgi:hypothetical protein